MVHAETFRVDTRGRGTYEITDPIRKVVAASGVREEFRLASKQGAVVIPLGSTGHVARELWTDLRGRLKETFGPHADAVVSHFEVLNDGIATDDAIIKAILAILKIVVPK